MAESGSAPVVERERDDVPDLTTAMKYKPKVLKCKLIRGCNIYHRTDVMCLEIELGWLAGLTTRNAGLDFTARFAERFFREKGLMETPETHRDFLERLDSDLGAPIEEALLQAVLAVEKAIRVHMNYLDPVDYAAIARGESRYQAALIWHTETPEISRASAGLAFEGFIELLPSRPGLPGEARPLVANGFAAGLKRLKRRARRRRLSGSTSLLKAAARERGLAIECVTGNHLRIGQGARQHHLFGSLPGPSAFGATKLAVEKRACNRRLMEASLPAPLQISAANVQQAYAAVERVGFPAVIKPSKGLEGRGVTANLKTHQEVLPAYEYAAARGQGVLVEEWIPGTDYRLLVVGGRFVAAASCVPPVVTGDGMQTIRELIEKLNEEPDRDDLRLCRVTVDSYMNRHLSRQGFSIDDVPNAGQSVSLRPSGDIDTGATPVDVTDSVHPDNRAMAEKAAECTGLEVAGIDFITTDITRSHREVGGGIIEIEARPDLRMHAWPREGLARDAASPILDLLFSPGSDGRIPTAVVAGDRGTGRIVRAAAGLLQARGYTVGLSLKRGAYLHGVPLNLSDDKLAEAPQILQRDPFLECLLGAVSLSRSAAHRLSFDTCDVAAIVPGPHDEHAHAFAQGMDVLIKANRGRFVVSADDTQARSVLAGIDPERVILVSNEGDDPDVRAQIAAGRCAVVTTWNGDSPHVTVFEGGQAAASALLPNGARTKAKNIITELFVLALMHALGLHNPKVVVNPTDTMTLQETGCLVGES